MVLADKFNEDFYHYNRIYAKAAGISTSLLNALEKKFLLAIDFQLFVSRKDLEEGYQMIEKNFKEMKPAIGMLEEELVR